MEVKFKKLDAAATVPEYKTEGAVGADITATEEILIPPKQVRTVRTGLAVALPPGWEMQIRSRSGLASKGVSVVNSPGTIDPDYRGEILVILQNISPDTFKVKKGMRVAQAVLSPVHRATFVEVEELDKTERGEKGLGSTGEG